MLPPWTFQSLASLELQVPSQWCHWPGWEAGGSWGLCVPMHVASDKEKTVIDGLASVIGEGQVKQVKDKKSSRASNIFPKVVF